MRSDGVLLIAIGGAVGTLLRYAIAEGIDTTSFPWPTLLVNVAGCALLAAVTAPSRPRSHQRILGAGFCGGLTTFSTFSVELATMLDDGRPATAAAYLVASLATGLVAYIGVRTMTHSESRSTEAR